MAISVLTPLPGNARTRASVAVVAELGILAVASVAPVVVAAAAGVTAVAATGAAADAVAPAVAEIADPNRITLAQGLESIPSAEVKIRG